MADRLGLSVVTESGGGLRGSVDFEVIPLKGVASRVLALPVGSTVTVTASPSMGIEATIDLVVELMAGGFKAVPHLSARLVADRRALAAIVKRLDAAGVTHVFVVGGDGPPRGSYQDAGSLLADLAENGHPFLEVGIAGYPESHPLISDERLLQALFEKTPHATYLVSQMCFSAGTIIDWVVRIRGEGVTLPVKVGVPGAVDPVRLVSVASRIGVGESIRFLAKNRSVLRILRPGPYRPGRLIRELERLDSGLGLTGLHFYTFNQVEATASWFRGAV